MTTKIQASWDKNAEEWNRIIISNAIPSRQFTNKAIVETLSGLNAFRILDCGCGEGWLTRKLTAMGKEAVGIDSTKKLISEAQKKGNESYYHMSYEDIIDGKSIPESPYDATVFNFCLYQEKGMTSLFTKTKEHMRTKSYIIVQTLHPAFIMQNGKGYRSQWFTDSWKGLPGNFHEGHSWFARTFEDWTKVFAESNLNILEVKEIVNTNHQPLSMIYVAQ
ncbi:class I SAM-dependent methyltransferase [Costertonia aggregata]|uniref:Class I SAM-dependent methyltransferase n=1 Tax=Costertonia aggregata TaxID=343403 RepID=A0A7H9AKR8_9FLAO|nr:class I SAM-dependent methyltransferase [Costertonia aggregata]QLG44071.1 class I SAM-dependent methyltransferase [Costertonia aggregata]